MTAEALTGYALWDLTPTRPVSRLFNVVPCGLGTPDGESLTSYVVRLAQAHRVSMHTLVAELLRPAVRQQLGRAQYRTQLAGLWLRDAATLNGTSPLTQIWVQCLTELTGRHDLEGLTMLRWADVVAATGLLRTTRVWCGCCYAEAPDGAVYDRLQWALEPVTICLRHQRPLDAHCPTCGRIQRVWAPHARPGSCFWCGAWLGATSAVPSPTDGPELAAWQIWIAQAVGDLIANAPALPARPMQERVQQVVSVMVERMPWRRVSALARLLETRPFQSGGSAALLVSSILSASCLSPSPPCLARHLGRPLVCCEVLYAPFRPRDRLPTPHPARPNQPSGLAPPAGDQCDDYR